MIEIHDRVDCCGCAACMNVCPMDCITMKRDEEGFEYPVVDELMCIGCQQCILKCPILEPVEEKPFRQTAYLAQHKDPEILAQSTSGGAFTALAQVILDRGGIVYGHGFNGNEIVPGVPEVQCFAVEDSDDLAKFRNSKYVQSKVDYALREVVANVEAGREVLFSGTPCECEGLIRMFDNEKPDNLYVVDVECRAVPSPAVFAAYVDWLERHFGRPVAAVRFRDKGKFGYRYSQICAFDGINPEPFYSAGVESDPYLRAFFKNMSDRPCCYECAFKKRYRLTDITMWDFFDVYRLDESFDDNRGVTRLLGQTPMGDALVRKAEKYMRIAPVSADSIVEGARELTHSAPLNENREAFMHAVVTLSGCEVLDSWFPDSLTVKAERAARCGLEKVGIYDQAKRIAKKVLGK